jgi:hypothetical protein
VLLDVTALLSSAHANAVAEAFGVPENQPRVVAIAGAVLSDDQRAFHAALDLADASGNPGSGTAPDPSTIVDRVIGSVAKVPASRLPKLTGMPLLQQLALLSRSELTDFRAQHGAVLARLAAHPPAATAVDAWWAGVPAAKQADLVAAAPGVVGNLEGVPYVVRDRANRSYLAQAEHGIRAQLRAGAGRAASDELARRLHMLAQVRSSLASGSSPNHRELIGLDPSGAGTAVIVIGDVNTADYVGYLIPGMFSSVDTQVVKFAQSADQIARDQQKMLDRLQPATATTRTPTAAVVAWIGYHTPSLANIASLDLAEQAQSALVSSIQGLRAERGADQPFISVMAHSYGSTAAMLALQDGDIEIDALAICGSPGSPAQSVSQLSVRNGNVWVGAAAWDPVPETGLFGSQPTSAGYGAHRFGVDGARDPLTGHKLAGAVSHNDYFVPGTESLRNIELIGIDRGDLVLGK